MIHDALVSYLNGMVESSASRSSTSMVCGGKAFAVTNRMVKTDHILAAVFGTNLNKIKF